MATKSNIVLVFDLDDTLYNEIDYLRSAYREIAQMLSERTNSNLSAIYDNMFDLYQKGENTFEQIIEALGIKDLKTTDLIEIYRKHEPEIQLSDNNEAFLSDIKEKVWKTGLITDGRSVQQRNKIKALGLNDYFDDIIISEEFGSEKPNIDNYIYFEECYKKNMTYIYVADNIKKDFISPNKLGWHSVCLLDNGKNIHKQNFDLSKDYLPKERIERLSDIAHTLNRLIKTV